MTVVDLKSWLKDNGIEFRTNTLKKGLISLVWKNLLEVEKKTTESEPKGDALQLPSDAKPQEKKDTKPTEEKKGTKPTEEKKDTKPAEEKKDTKPTEEKKEEKQDPNLEEKKIYSDIEIKPESEKMANNNNNKIQPDTTFHFGVQEKNGTNNNSNTSATTFQFGTTQSNDLNTQISTEPVGFQFNPGSTKVNKNIFDEDMEIPTGTSFSVQVISNAVVESTGFCFGKTKVNDNLFKENVNRPNQFGATINTTKESNQTQLPNTEMAKKIFDNVDSEGPINVDPLRVGKKQPSAESNTLGDILARKNSS
jgi:hypothetical protein